MLFQAQGRVLQYLHLLFQHHDVAVVHAMSASSGTDLIGVISCSTSTLVPGQPGIILGFSLH